MELSPPNAYANQVTSGIMKPTFWLIKEATKQVLVDGKSRTRQVLQIFLTLSEQFFLKISADI